MACQFLLLCSLINLPVATVVSRIGVLPALLAVTGNGDLFKGPADNTTRQIMPAGIVSTFRTTGVALARFIVPERA